MSKSNKIRRVKSTAAKPVVAFAMGTLNQMHDSRRRLSERARELDWRLIDLVFRGGTFPAASAVHGLIADSESAGAFRLDVTACGCPAVMIGRGVLYNRPAGVPVVLGDMVSDGVIAAEHFAERGFKHVAYVRFEPWGENRPMQEAFAARAVELGCDCRELAFTVPEPGLDVPNTAKELYLHRSAQFANWIRDAPKPLGLFVFCDGLAITLFGMCMDAGIAVPEEMALLGRDDIASLCESLPRTLSSVRHDQAGKIDKAIELLQQLMQGNRLSEMEYRIPPSGVTIRESTDVLASTDLSVAKALRYIWDRIDQNISVVEVADSVGMSCRNLARRFSLELGRGMNAEINRRRLEETCELLRSTDLAIGEISEMVGFNSPTYLYRVFQKAYGLTPRKYRLQQKKKS